MSAGFLRLALRLMQLKLQHWMQRLIGYDILMRLGRWKFVVLALARSLTVDVCVGVEVLLVVCSNKNIAQATCNPRIRNKLPGMSAGEGLDVTIE